MAFQVAGCNNVIATLWKVDDRATAALMVKFYHALWVEQRPAIEALREAQLFVYRRSDLIPDLAGTRGSLRMNAALREPSRLPTAAAAGQYPRKPAKYWASFTMFGSGY